MKLNGTEVLVAKQKSTVDLTTGNIWENIWHMSWPMLIVMFFNFLVGFTDVYVAGFLGPEIQAIVGFVSQLYFSIIIVANAISIGTVALLSRGCYNLSAITMTVHDVLAVKSVYDVVAVINY